MNALTLHRIPEAVNDHKPHVMPRSAEEATLVKNPHQARSIGSLLLAVTAGAVVVPAATLSCMLGGAFLGGAIVAAVVGIPLYCAVAAAYWLTRLAGRLFQ